MGGWRQVALFDRHMTHRHIRDLARDLRFAIPLSPGYMLDIFTQRGRVMAGKKILMLVGDYAEDSENI